MMLVPAITTKLELAIMLKMDLIVLVIVVV